MHPTADLALKECLSALREAQVTKKRQDWNQFTVGLRWELTNNTVDYHEIIAATVVEAVEVLVLYMSSSQTIAAL